MEIEEGKVMTVLRVDEWTNAMLLKIIVDDVS